MSRFSNMKVEEIKQRHEEAAKKVATLKVEHLKVVRQSHKIADELSEAEEQLEAYTNELVSRG